MCRHPRSLATKVFVLAVATLGTLACNVVDDVVRAGIKAGAKGADEAVGAGAGHLDDAARKGAGAVDDVKPAIVADESDRLGGAVELGADLALEFAPTAFESDAPAPTTFVELVHEPKYANLLAESEPWTRLRDSSEGSGNAPWIFAVRPEGEGVLVETQTIPFAELAATCWRLGTTCVFVGCEDDACSMATQSVFADLGAKPDTRVDAYTTAFIDKRMTTAPQPAFMMFVGGSPTREFTLVRPKPK